MSLITDIQAKGRVIALEGLIGAGKSTLVDKIKGANPNIEVLKEQINPALLALFYSDPVKYGFAMQWSALQQRIYQSKLLEYGQKHSRIEDAYLNVAEFVVVPATGLVEKKPQSTEGKSRATTCVWDRSMLGDYAFALWNHLTGNLNRAEMDAYESMFGASVSRDHPASIVDTPFVSHVDTYFWLVDDPMECKRRVELRQSNPAEQGIPDQYYRGLEDVHIFLFLKLLSDPAVNHKVKVRRWEQYHNAKSLEELFLEPIARLPALTQVLTGTVENPQKREPAHYKVYYTPPALALAVTRSKAGVKQDVIDRYGFYFLNDQSKAELYQYLSDGGDPMRIVMNMDGQEE